MLEKLKKSLAIKPKNKNEIVDIILFGSAVKGKYLPKDIDICIIFKNKPIPEILKEIEEKAKKTKLNIHISTLTAKNFFTAPHSLIKTILKEGRSILTKKTISEIYGLSAYSLYTYSLTKMTPTEKVRFIYTVKGRKNEKGFVKKIGGEWITDSCFIIPINKDSEIQKLLKRWNIQYKRKNVLLMN